LWLRREFQRNALLTPSERAVPRTGTLKAEPA
jgi:hypothetical protein